MSASCRGEVRTQVFMKELGLRVLQEEWSSFGKGLWQTGWTAACEVVEG